MPLFKTSRKVQMFGTSLAMTIPAMYVKINGIEKGDRLKVFYDLSGVLILRESEDQKELKECLLNFIESLEKE
jgi:antitoxin component of MazEF toxin-antitoxin module